MLLLLTVFFFSSIRRHTRLQGDWSSDVCSSDLCYRVLTREGYEVEVTAGHKFAFWNDAQGGFDVKPIEDFRPGDALYKIGRASCRERRAMVWVNVSVYDGRSESDGVHVIGVMVQ